MYSSYSSSTATDMDHQKPSADPPQLRSGNPPVQTPPPGTEAPWSTGLFSCFDDVPNCCITCWCPCITFGQIAEIADEGAISWGASAAIYTLIGIFTGCACCYSCFYRMKLRKQYRLSESPCADCCVHWFCESCALCQEYRELKNRGFDMSEGCVTCYLPCVTFGQIAEIVDKGETSCCKAGAIHSLIPCGLRLLVEPCCLGSYRTKLRQQYSLPEAPCNDCLISCFCERCALCQHYRELKKQGFDMSAGWEGNLAKKRGEMAVPLAEGGMTRDK